MSQNELAIWCCWKVAEWAQEGWVDGDIPKLPSDEDREKEEDECPNQTERVLWRISLQHYRCHS